MKSSIYFISFLLGVLMLIFSCKKYEQTFDYHPINTVTIKTDTTSYTITQLDTLKINPLLTESMPGGDTFTYQWKFFPQSAGASPVPTVILSTEKSLKASINTPPGLYALEYKVTNVKTGVATIQLSNVTVNGAFFEGWLVASNTATKAQLSFIRADGILFLNPAEEVNKRTYIGKALSVHATSGRDLSLTMFFTDQGVYRFNANDFVQNGTKADLFPLNPTLTGASYYGFQRGAIDQFVVNNGNLYATIGPVFGAAAALLGTFSDRFTGDYYLFPGQVSSTQFASYFYDNKNMRFVQVAATGRAFTAVPATPSGSYNVANVGRTMLAIDYGVRSTNSDEFYFVMQGAAGRYVMSMDGNNVPVMNQLIGNSPDIDIATSFATSSLVKQLYYAAANKIYLYDMLANASRLVYTFPAGYLIKEIKMLRTTSRRIVAAVNKGTDGEVYYFDLENTGDFTGNSFQKKYTGFGEIVNLSYK